ncbi:DUF2945 domain-containing protein [Streptomyces sp. Z26]|uniref:DUF2945 domain-containing protein n=1 Tax=Streptomyces TaxID=1883 RepID=UPI001F0BF77A|nr:DUF2945 domain-containing protein [Streptomyces sp. Z26]
MAKHKKFEKNERVAWASHGSQALGRVKRKITGRARAGGRTVDASPEEPQYEVESEKSGGRAVHRPEALRRKGEGSRGRGR